MRFLFFWRRIEWGKPLEKSQEQEISIRAVSPNPTNPAMNLQSKQRGELAELAFMFKALSMGFGVAKPWGDSERYDFILSAGRVLLRVQIKSIWVTRRCSVKTSGNTCAPYTPEEIDFLVLFVIPQDLWYIIPAVVIGGRKGIYIRPSSPECAFKQYRDAWGLFGHPLSP